MIPPWFRTRESSGTMLLRLACVLSLAAVVCSELVLRAQIKSQWEKFKSKHLKSYKEGEEQQRQENFKKNVELILQHNLQADLGEHDHRLSVNQFADMSIQEFRQKKLGKLKFPERDNSTVLHASLVGRAPASLDWRDKGVVTRIKDQGDCGSCYTFAVAGALESAWAIKTGDLIELSEQNLLDCAQKQYGYSNAGCDGGLEPRAYRYIIDNGGISTEKCYPYEEAVGSCRYKASCRGATMTRYVTSKFGDELAMKDAVAVSPVSVGVDASLEDFVNYGGGIYKNFLCSEELDHAVQVVGYGTEGTKDYWIIKNSWGTTWGEKGYMRIARNLGNQCGIANEVRYPVV